MFCDAINETTFRGRRLDASSVDVQSKNKSVNILRVCACTRAWFGTGPLFLCLTDSSVDVKRAWGNE